MRHLKPWCWLRPRLGGFIPAFAGQRVVYGHPYETINAKVREQQVKDFYAGTIDRAQVLRDETVDYIIVGPRERKLGRTGYRSSSRW